MKEQVLKREPQWYIGLRQSKQEALRRVGLWGSETQYLKSYAILEVEFTPLGVAHFCTTFDNDWKFQPFLFKVFNLNWATWDKGVWHFNSDLPLSLSDSHGNRLVSYTLYDLQSEQLWYPGT